MKASIQVGILMLGCTIEMSQNRNKDDVVEDYF